MRRRSTPADDRALVVGATASGAGRALEARVRELRRQLDATRGVHGKRRRYTPTARAAIADLVARYAGPLTPLLAALGVPSNVVYKWPEWRARVPRRRGDANGRQLAAVEVEITRADATATNGHGGLVLTTPSGCVVSHATVAEIAALVRALEGDA